MFQAQYKLEKRFSQGISMPQYHFHDHCELYLPLCSGGSLHIEDREFSLNSQSLFFLRSHSLHRIESPGDYGHFILHISPDTLDALSTPQTDFRSLNKSAYHQGTLSSTEVAEVQTLLQGLESPSEGFGADLRQTMCLLSLLLLVTPLLNPTPDTAPPSSKDFQRISPVLDYIQENLSEPLSLDQIANSFYISKHYLCRIFKTTTGFSVTEYIIQCRIAKARQYLLQGYSVQRAGELSGFSDNSHFIRTFGKLTGISPGKYTKEYGKSQHISL